jgi:uncharacterized membrane protein YphA (DoxX/SURF4 family)
VKILLWVLQIGLAGFFGMAGFGKVATPVEDLAATMPWVESFPSFMVPVIGGLELAAAIGLILPAALGILEILTPLAATGLALIMIGAIVVHAVRGEWMALPANIVLTAVLGFVAWRRFVMLRTPTAAELAESATV